MVRKLVSKGSETLSGDFGRGTFLTGHNRLNGPSLLTRQQFRRPNQIVDRSYEVHPPARYAPQPDTGCANGIVDCTLTPRRKARSLRTEYGETDSDAFSRRSAGTDAAA